VTICIDDYRDKVTIADGAWATELDKWGCPPGICREELNVTQPDCVKQVVERYIQAGAQIVLTNTCGANKWMLEPYGLSNKTIELNHAGAQISKKAAANQACVFGTIGTSGKIVLMNEVGEDELADAFSQQARALTDGGADALLVTKMTEMAEAVAAIKAAKATGLLVAGTMTFDSGPDRTHTAMGVAIQDAVEKMVEAGADIVGCECGVGIEDYAKIVEIIHRVTDKPIWVKADAGLPEIDGGKIVYPLKPQEYADQAKKLVEAGANIIGGCCGTSPDFVRALCQTLLH